MRRIFVRWFFASVFTYLGSCQTNLHYCEFDEEKITAKFNFTSLSATDKDYVIKHESTNEVIRLQLCKPLIEECNDTPGSGACLKQGNKEISLGKEPQIFRDDGSIIFKYTGDVCKDTTPYTLSVLMYCSYENITSYPELISYSKKQCNLFAVWRTRAACAHTPNMPVESVNCTLQDSLGNVYDLSSLKKLTENYVVPIDKKSSIIFNICHPVVYGHQAVCLEESGACLRTQSDQLSYSKLGTVSNPILHGTDLILEYKDGSICKNTKTKNAVEHYRTTISFICDFKARDTHPEYLGGKDDCHLKLRWRTVAACNEKAWEDYSSKMSGSCKITVPVTEIEYDFNPLKGKDYIISSKNGSGYKISVCEPVSSNFCKVGPDDPNGEAGVCSTPSRAIGGKANSNLRWSPVFGPYLNYTDGSLCEHNQRRFTIISFTCGQDDPNNTPAVIEDTSCHLYIQWKTLLVCRKKEISCGLGSEGQANELCLNETLTAVLSTTLSPATFSGDTGASYKVITTLIILLGVCGFFVTVYLLNSRRREHLNSCCRSWCFRRPDVQMQYSRINTVEETDALLDAPDTNCQSDSDDDLLSFDSLT